MSTQCAYPGCSAVYSSEYGAQQCYRRHILQEIDKVTTLKGKKICPILSAPRLSAGHPGERCIGEECVAYRLVVSEEKITGDRCLMCRGE